MACIAAVSQGSVAGLGAIAQLRTSTLANSIKTSLAPTTRRSFAVRCEAEPESKAPAAVPTPTPTPIATPAPKKASTKFGDVFAFSGPAPETINGRLAMVGFVTALGVELATGAPLTRQLADNASVSWFFFAVSLFSTASLIPMFQGITVDSKSGGFFNSKAETLNGRAAMMGLVALAITEFVKGSPLI